MGTGLNLYAGSVIIFVDHPWTKAAYDQAVDRCHRIGQRNNLIIYNLMCHDTIDERIWEIIKRKGELSNFVIDGVDISDKSSLIDYLLS
jgi:SNF2 family DNA or RNA helicase